MKTAAEVYCRGCQHYDLDGTGGCAGILDGRKAEETPPCNTYELNENGEPNW